MKKVTQEMFDSLPVVNGYKICPKGDYSDLKLFTQSCKFAARSLFAHKTIFIEPCRFGKGCIFGERCRFGEGTRFGAETSIGKLCTFGAYSNVGAVSVVGDRCQVAPFVLFGDACRFGSQIAYSHHVCFGEKCEFEGEGVAKQGYPMMSITSILKPNAALPKYKERAEETSYFFNLEGGIYVRCGIFAGTLNEFKQYMLSVGATNMVVIDSVIERFNS